MIKKLIKLLLKILGTKEAQQFLLELAGELSTLTDNKVDNFVVAEFSKLVNLRGDTAVVKKQIKCSVVPYEKGMDMTGIYVGDDAALGGHPRVGDMILTEVKSGERHLVYGDEYSKRCKPVGDKK